MNYKKGVNINYVKLGNEDVTNKIKQIYGINNDWQNTNWKYIDLFGKDSINKNFYIEYLSLNNIRYWTYGYINNVNDYFYPSKFYENIEINISDLNI